VCDEYMDVSILDYILIFQYFGPSKVSALPLGFAVESSVHYFGEYFSFPGHILSPMGSFLTK
jgi:hypothetical protein